MKVENFVGVVQLNGALNKYIKNFNENLVFTSKEVNPGGSGLGAWVNLALIGFALKDVLTDLERREVESTLGLPLSVAYQSVEELIATVPNVVSFAVGCWVADPDSPQLMKQLLSDVANIGGTDTGSPIPAASFLDEWISEKTLGVVNEFPVDFTDAVALLVNTVATKISWVIPFEVDENADNFWGKNRLVDYHAHGVELFEGEQFNYAVYSKHSTAFPDGSRINVCSVVGDKNVTMKDLFDQFMEDRNKGRGVNGFHPEKMTGFFEEGFGDFVSFRKQKTLTGAPVDFEVIIPAWSSDTAFDDLSTVGFKIFDRALDEADLLVKNKQVTVAKYHKEGFEAASVTTGMFMATGMPIRSETLNVQVDFSNPFLSVVFYEPPVKHQLARHPEFKNHYDWDGVPLFVHVVNEADNVTETS